MTKRTATHPEDFDLTFDLGHASRSIDVPSSDQLYGDFFPPLHVEAEFDLTELALTQGLKEQVRAELGNGATGVGGSVGHCCGVRVDVTVCWEVIIRNLVWLMLRGLNIVGRPFSRRLRLRG